MLVKVTSSASIYFMVSNFDHLFGHQCVGISLSTVYTRKVSKILPNSLETFSPNNNPQAKTYCLIN